MSCMRSFILCWVWAAGISIQAQVIEDFRLTGTIPSFGFIRDDGTRYVSGTFNAVKSGQFGEVLLVNWLACNLTVCEGASGIAPLSSVRVIGQNHLEFHFSKAELLQDSGSSPGPTSWEGNAVADNSPYSNYSRSSGSYEIRSVFPSLLGLEIYTSSGAGLRETQSAIFQGICAGIAITAPASGGNGALTVQKGILRVERKIVP
jgi:hypothetical protein